MPTPRTMCPEKLATIVLSSLCLAAAALACQGEIGEPLRPELALDSCGSAECKDKVLPRVCEPVCIDDGNACTVQTPVGFEGQCPTTCLTDIVDTCVDDDGCCPASCSFATDNDCSASCGDGVLDDGETCDGDCPTSCDDADACTVDTMTGAANNCSAACSYAAIAACNDGDGCCPGGCDASTDDDCSETCGNGEIDDGETCDGDCPATCDDNDACTADTTTGSLSTCDITCSNEPIDTCNDGDGCCPSGCNFNNDSDCDSPCAGVNCPANAQCEPATASCRCNDGYYLIGDSCQMPAEGDPAARTEGEVCTRFAESNAVQVPNGWSGPDSGCGIGTVTEEAYASGVERQNFYRWLTGLAPVSEDPELRQILGECGAYLRARGGLTHYPEPGEPCYTEGADTAAGHSNISGGRRSLGGSVDGFIYDNGNADTLGHRRWILHPPIAYTAFGQVDRYICQWVDWGRSGPDRINPDYVAWPNQGFVPHQLMPQFWSFTSTSIGLGNAEVSMTRMSDGQPVPITQSWHPAANYGNPTFAWTISGETSPGESYEVRLDNVTIGGSSSSLTYVVRPTNCN